MRAGSPDSLRASLLRSELAAARRRAALGALEDLEEHDVLALQHLDRAGELTPGRLAALLRVSSGGMTALLGRLERRGLVTRVPHPGDARSRLVRLTPRAARLAAEASALHVADVAAAADALSGAERDAVVRFLAAVAAAAECRADDLAHSADAAATAPPPVTRLLS